LWTTALGRQTLDLESTSLSALVRRLHGDTVLWAGTHAVSARTLEGCMVRNCVFVQQEFMQADLPSEDSETMNLSAQLEAMPFKTNSVDGVVLHHALEVTDDARVALREVTRVLVPGGRLIICGFNPYSTIGLRRLYARKFDDSLSRHRIYSPMRLFDWLLLLGFELDVKPVYCGYGLQFKSMVETLNMPWLGKLEPSLDRIFARIPSALPFGSLIIISAVKQAVPMKPQRFSKNVRRARPSVAYPSVAPIKSVAPSKYGVSKIGC